MGSSEPQIKIFVGFVAATKGCEFPKPGTVFWKFTGTRNFEYILPSERTWRSISVRLFVGTTLSSFSFSSFFPKGGTDRPLTYEGSGGYIILRGLNPPLKPHVFRSPAVSTVPHFGRISGILVL